MEKQYTFTKPNGDKYYYKNKARTIFHRLDGPAIEHTNGYKVWYVDDKLHRLDGPAVEHADGGRSWYVNGVFIFMLNSKGEMIDRMV